MPNVGVSIRLPNLYVHLLLLCLWVRFDRVFGASDSEVNSTEISTDSEFDDEQPQRVPPSFHLEFKPLVEVDPTIKLVQNRAPLAVPRPGDYVLSKTASTEGIASKKSLELKKKYLLGEGTTGLGILKSGSASALDSKFKSFHSNITECQKLLNPAAQISPTMQTFLKNSTTNLPSTVGNRSRDESSTVPVPALPSESVNDTEKENVYEGKRTGSGNANGSSSTLALGANKRSSLVETINTTLVENKLNEIKSNESFPAPAGKEDQKSEQQPIASEQQQTRSHNSSPVSKTKHPQGGEQDSVGNGHIDPTAKLKNSINNNNNNNKRNNNNNNNNDEEVLEIIDLVTPEKVKVSTNRDNVANETGGLGEHKYITNLKQTYIDLTTDSPNCDRSLVETTLDFSIAPSKLGNERPTNSSAVPDIISNIRIDSNENKIEPNATPANGVVVKQKQVGKATSSPPEQQQAQQQQGEDGCHETTLQVPLDVPWTKEEEIESDSISESGSNSSEISSSSSSSSSSSTSSVEDIPHFILDSTTSPETQNDERFVPRLEVRDATGELMQIDSLMIIDGRYIGDPEDLKLMEKLPPDTQIAAQMLQAEINQDSINTVVEGECALPCAGQLDDEGTARANHPGDTSTVETKSDTEEGECASTPTPLPAKADPVSSLSNFVSQRNPGFKFDSRNENKIDTLKNLPFVLDADQRSSLQKSMHLNLNQPPVDVETDTEQTPMAGEIPGGKLLASPTVPLYTKGAPPDADSDSQDDTEVTTQNNLTETELSDWAADDAVSENFVDLEFALNSNKGTIRRNHKPKHLRLQHKKLPSSSNGDVAAMVRSVPASYTAAHPQPRNGITATEDGIIRNLALEDIEFMDTGSEEESCIETYSTTNRMMLKNRGYVEIMDPSVESKRTVYPPLNHAYSTGQPKLVEAINNQVAGRQQMDYIEQGSYLLTNDEAKTPMNEEPLGKITFCTLASQNMKLGEQVGSVESAPDIEEDSLLLVSSSQGTAPGTTTNSTATNEESDALTMVVATPPAATGHEPDQANPSTGSGRGSVTSFSSSLHCGGAVNSNGHSSTAADRTPDPELATKSSSRSRDESPARKISVESLSGKRSSLERKDVRKDSLKSIEDIGYEKYVKRLQQKIQQISNARDSLEVKKGKRKSSKGEMVLTLSEADKEVVEEPVYGESAATAAPGQQTDAFAPDHQQKLGTVASASVPEPDTQQPKSVEKKIEEITKERVKQKDLIHDLVMDKLQTKKQLNAEKRLNRSRNRSNVLVGQGSNGGATVEQPVGGGDSPVTASASFRSGGTGSLKDLERTPLAISNQSNVYSSVMSMRALPSSVVPGAFDMSKENIGFPNGKPTPHHQEQILTTAYQQQLITPRTTATTFVDGEQPLTTEQLREEARSRARLKSNQDLGLSPEDRLLLLRKKYHITMRGLTDDDEVDAIEPNKSDDAKCKDQSRTKLITSKSVNDVSMLKQQQQVLPSLHHHHHHHHHHHQPGLLVTSAGSIAKVDPSMPAGELQHSTPKKLTDYISDPNLMHTGTIEQDTGSEVRLRTRGKRGKDRERRKSIIEKVSEFFNGRKKTEGGGSKESSPTKDRPSLLTANGGGPSDGVPAAGTSSSTGGGFLRFKISPKLKDKSKVCLWTIFFFSEFDIFPGTGDGDFPLWGFWSKQTRKSHALA
uniref:Uncharacterized protein n=1 Tax=Anopheles maculatus TaxID=74869 RepID=A0A182SNR4_9DIPT